MKDMNLSRAEEQAKPLSDNDLGFLGFWSWDLKSGLLDASEGIDRFFGLCFGKVQNETLPISLYEMRIHPDDLAWLRHERPRCFGPSGHGIVEYRVVDEAGAVRWVLCKAIHVTDQDGVMVRAHGLLLDITALKEDGTACRTAPSSTNPLHAYVDTALQLHAAAIRLQNADLIEQAKDVLLTAGRHLARANGPLGPPKH